MPGGPDEIWPDGIWVHGDPGKRRLLFLQDGAVAEIWHEAIAGKIGAIHNARITRVFADQGRATGQLGDGSDISVRIGKRDHMQAGALVPITIVGAPRDGKAWQAIMGARLVSPYFVYLPYEQGLFISKSIAQDPLADDRQIMMNQLSASGGGAIMRRMAAGVDLSILTADLAGLSQLWQSGMKAVSGNNHGTTGSIDGSALLHDAGGVLALAARHAPNLALNKAADSKIFSTIYDDAIDAASVPAVPLPSGGLVWIERTHALTAIDLDSGTGSLAAMMREAPAVIARHLRLRSLTGLIAIDVPRASPADARRFTADLEQCFARDPRVPEILGRSRGGLLECRIAHGQPPLAECLKSTHYGI